MAQMDLQDDLQNQQPGQQVGFVIVPSKDSTAVVVVSTYNLMDGKCESTGRLYLTRAKAACMKAITINRIQKISAVSIDLS